MTTCMFYVYILARATGKPFYVGKGKGNRIYAHESEAQRGCHCHKCRTIRKIWRNGGEVQRYTVFTTEDEQEALNYECNLIAQIGRKNLCNKTDGGDGVSGRPMSKANRRAVAEANRNRQHSLSSRIKRRIAAIGRWHSEATREKIRQSHIGRKLSDESRAKIGAASRARGSITPEMTEKARAAWTGQRHTPASIERIREGARNRSDETEARRGRALTDSNARQRANDPAYQLMFDLLNQGTHPDEIVQQTGLSARTVYRWKKQLNS